MTHVRGSLENTQKAEPESEGEPEAKDEADPQPEGEPEPEPEPGNGDAVPLAEEGDLPPPPQQMAPALSGRP